jgi:uroporphyrinogen decarboxylase
LDRQGTVQPGARSPSAIQKHLIGNTRPRKDKRRPPPYARATINNTVDAIRRMFKWAAHELVPCEVRSQREGLPSRAGIGYTDGHDSQQEREMSTSKRRDFIKSASVASLGSVVGMKVALAQTAPAESGKQGPLPGSTRAAKPAKSKRDLMLEVLDMAVAPSYVPAAFFMHFGVKGDAAIKAHLDHFHGTGMDFVKIQFDEQELRFPPNAQIKTAQDWAKIPILPEKWFEPSLYLLKGLIKAAKAEALIIQTVYSPYQMAKQAVPWKVLVEHVKQDAESVCRGMENITLSLLNFVQAASRLGVDGFYVCAQGGETNRVADRGLFNKTIKAYDMLLYKEASQLVPFNILHICDYEGSYEEFALRFQDYPGKVVNVPLTADGKPLSLRQAADIFKRPIMGGLDRHGVLSTGSPEGVKKVTLEALRTAPANFILGADCTVSPQIPLENLRTAIKTAHEYRR